MKSKRIFIYPYINSSKSVKALVSGLPALAIKRKESRFRDGARKLVINWGRMKLPSIIDEEKVVNHPDAVRDASNKLRTLKVLTEAGVPCPKFTTDIEVAKEWLTEKQGRCVFARKLLHGKAGAGILACTHPEELPPAPLYTRYIKKQDEYRVHVIGGNVVDVQRKMRRNGAEADWRIRTGANGFIFGRGGIEPPEQVLEVAVRAVVALALDFGGVDVIWQRASEKAFVLEVNTAPGIEGTTVGIYADAFKEMANEEK